MPSFLTKLFDTSDFPARWHCGMWTPFEGWLHIVSDVLIFAAYTAIPLVILIFRLRRRDAAYGPLYWMFCAFIFSCGTVHLIEAVIFWEPLYRLSGLVKAFTAVVSIATVIVLVRVAPTALKLPGQAALADRLQLEVAERQRTEDELRIRNAELDQFASLASHDLREPLRKISFFCDQMRHDAGNRFSEDSDAALDVILGAVARSQELIGGLLAFSRLGRVALADDRVDLGELCREVAAERVALDPDLGFEYLGSAPPVRGDRTLLRQLVENMVANAAKYRHQERPCRIAFEAAVATDGAIQLTVCDNGIGFDAADAERIFLPFERLHGRDRYPGIGMGLAICRRIAEAHGGGLRAEPMAAGGARFILEIPAARRLDHGP